MTLYVSFLLHIYQPPTQSPTVLKQIIKESYKPLINLLKLNESSKMTFNINGSLLELLEFYQESELLSNIKELLRRNQIDLVGSSCYHAILPLIPKEEMIRQMELNEQIHREVLGEELFNPKGFWLPEMAYEYRVIDPLFNANYKWTVISSVASPDKELPDNYIPYVNPDFTIFFRNDLLSNLISFKNPTVDEFYTELIGENDPEKDDYYVILAMDGETYGHHVKGLIENFLQPLLMKIKQDPNIKLIKINEISTIFQEKKKISPLPSSWSTSEEDLRKGVPFPLWSDPENRIHNLQLTVMNHTLYLVGLAQKYQNNNNDNENSEDIKRRFKNARAWLDKGLHSCQLWWASGKPWYSSEMILKGLNQLILASSEALKVILWNSSDGYIKDESLKIFNEIFEAQKEIYLSV
ncbi:MAG: hypothetical protein HZR80_08340 [Candidatus Heimdallarchaeota archaeon]